MPLMTIFIDKDLYSCHSCDSESYYKFLWIGWPEGWEECRVFVCLFSLISFSVCCLSLKYFPWREYKVRTFYLSYSVQFSSITQSCPTLCNPMNRSTPGLPVHHQLPEPDAHFYQVGDAIQPSHPLSSPSPPVFNLSQHQGLFQWASSLNQVAKGLEFRLQHQSFQWTPRTDLEFQ